MFRMDGERTPMIPTAWMAIQTVWTLQRTAAVTNFLMVRVVPSYRMSVVPHVLSMTQLMSALPSMVLHPIMALTTILMDLVLILVQIQEQMLLAHLLLMKKLWLTQMVA